MSDPLEKRYEKVTALKDEALARYVSLTTDPSSLTRGTPAYAQRAAVRMTVDNYTEEEKRLFKALKGDCSVTY